MKKFEVIIDIESFYITVEAESKDEAIEKTLEKFNVEDQNYWIEEINEIKE